MSSPEIGVVGPRADDEVLVLSRALRERGAKVRVIDLTGLPGAHRLEVRDDEVAYDGRSLSTLQAVYLRRLRHLLEPTGLRAAAASDDETWLGSFAEHLDGHREEREVGALIRSALELLRAPLVNGLEAQLVHPRKIHHLRTLAAAGVPVPPFVSTNDVREIERFAAEQGKAGAVIKPLRGLLKTQRFEVGHGLPDLARRPVLIQRFVAGATVRVYATAGHVVAAAELSNTGHVDSSVDPGPARLVELTAEEQAVVRRATRAVDLPFTGMDLQRPADGGTTQVLECNAAPMFANFHRRTGADVPGSLADYLLHRARDGDAWDEKHRW